LSTTRNTLCAVQSIGIVATRDPEVFRAEGSPNVRITFRGLRDSRTAADRDTRVSITIPVVQAARLWHLLDDHLSITEKT
jgi:hypothetical protein